MVPIPQTGVTGALNLSEELFPARKEDRKHMDRRKRYMEEKAKRQNEFKAQIHQRGCRLRLLQLQIIMLDLQKGQIEPCIHPRTQYMLN